MPALGGIVLSLWGCQAPTLYWIKIAHPWVQKMYPVQGLGCGGRLLRHFHTPILYWIIFFSLRSCRSLSVIYFFCWEILCELWREFGGIFQTHRIKGLTFVETFRTIFRKKFRSSKKGFVPTSLCRRRATLQISGCDNRILGLVAISAPKQLFKLPSPSPQTPPPRQRRLPAPHRLLLTEPPPHPSIFN